MNLAKLFAGDSMKRLIAVIFTIGLTFGGTVKPKSGRHVVLPNSKLIGCKASDCSQVWQGTPVETAAIYPHNVNIDVDNGAVLGNVGQYEKPVNKAEHKGQKE